MRHSLGALTLLVTSPTETLNTFLIGAGLVLTGFLARRSYRKK